MSEIDDSTPTYDELAAHLTAIANSRPENEQLFRDAAAALLTEHNKIIAQGDDFPLGKACDLSGEGNCEACQ